MKWLKSLFEKIRSTKKFRRALWLFSRDKPISEGFLDLTPVTNADIDGLYRNALDFAMRTPSIRNVALTGPYGSGKTSVIKTYEKSSPFLFLNISLATFSDPNTSENLDSTPTSEEVTVKVERSILQQMLYGADTRSLPYSRFKRITKPSWLSLNALGFAFWIIICGYIYRERENILSVTTVDDVKPLWFFCCLYVFSYFARLISQSLKASHSLSVKKLSLQGGAVELDGTPESSILNKYLDEIIYFFEENNYDAVVFEDLDRFGSPEIFIKLREINKIINDRPKRSGGIGSLKASQPLKFFYAIKDDVFFNKDRAKFFDFITPIVPIINNSNSREMFARCIARDGGKVSIDSHFLREVSLYLDDYRLIKNICNEFLVYEGKIGGVPNPNKLLAIIIYKNTYPKDFESLHHGKGALFNIVELRSDLVARASADADTRIDAIRELILESENEFCSAQEDLVRIFWGQLCGGNPGHFINGVYADSELLTLDNILVWDNFKKIFNENPIRIHGMVAQPSYYHIQPSQISLGLSFRELEGKAIPGSKFEVRNERVKNKIALRRNQLNAEIADIKEDKADFARLPLRQLLIHANAEIDAAIADSEISDSRLLKYLVKNGFLDETYHLYISIFHEGRLSRNDWNFIQMIRDFRPVDPEARIDNPREVVAEMREEDFGAEYVLNVALMDYLLATDVVSFSKIRSAVEFISRRFSEAENFFQAYWVSGRTVAAFTKAVSENWSGYGVASIGSDQSPRHVANIIAYADPAYIATQMNIAGALSRYLATHSNLVFSENISFANGYQALKLMSVKLEKLQELGRLNELAVYACQNSLYLLSVNNIEFAFLTLCQDVEENSGASTNYRTANYTAISQAESQAINDYVLENVNSYLEDVALMMESNSEESEDAIVKIANHPDVDHGLATQYALRQNFLFESFHRLPKFMWGELLFAKKVVIGWPNIFDYYCLDDADTIRLSAFLDNETIVNNLVDDEMPMADGDDKDGKALSWFVINNVDIGISNYEKLCQCSRYVYLNFPKDMSLDRKMVLARIGKIALNENTFSETSDSPLLRAALIKEHFASFLKKINDYPIDIDVKLNLLALSSGNHAAQIIKWISLEELRASVFATDQVALYLSSEGSDINGFDREVIVYCLANCSSQKVAVDLLFKSSEMLTDAEVTEALRAAPDPYCQFVKENTRQKLPNNEKNMTFAKALESRKIISSVSDEGSFIRVNAFRKGITKFLLGDG
ncbi:hypothetical protein E5170_19435 [Pseudomonas atacamensis]|uniref:YobI-like P-loop NTPase domain-containing protein n=1 Tax=Pseudomonas atacamensis TaxID=2565368 RepID=A0AAQ2DAD3_9PSED|nr:hypothetical protein [Pseudomonas atacamensis]THF29367.1 hypothetical protein E5170_19435 [Pseudomonas atacamensis]